MTCAYIKLSYLYFRVSVSEMYRVRFAAFLLLFVVTFIDARPSENFPEPKYRGYFAPGHLMEDAGNYYQLLCDYYSCCNKNDKQHVKPQVSRGAHLF
jgi:hypothetical protein